MIGAGIPFRYEQAMSPRAIAPRTILRLPLACATGSPVRPLRREAPALSVMPPLKPVRGRWGGLRQYRTKSPYTVSAALAPLGWAEDQRKHPMRREGATHASITRLCGDRHLISHEGHEGRSIHEARPQCPRSPRSASPSRPSRLTLPSCPSRETAAERPDPGPSRGAQRQNPARNTPYAVSRPPVPANRLAGAPADWPVHDMVTRENPARRGPVAGNLPGQQTKPYAP